MTIRHLSAAAAALALAAGAAVAEDGAPGAGSEFSYRSTWGASNQGAAQGHAPAAGAQAPATGGHASEKYNTHCGPGGWDANGGPIPDGCRTGAPVSSSTSPLGMELPEARPGECFARVVIPAEFDHVPETVVTKDAHEVLSANPAQFSDGVETVVTKDASVRYVVREPRFEARTEQVLVRPAHQRLEIVPATFRTVTEHVTVGEPRMVWKPGKNLSNVQRKDPHTGAVYCLVEEPAETVAVTRQVLETPAQVRSVPAPAEYKTVQRMVLTDPGGVEEIPVPAEHADVPVKRLAQPASQSASQVPAQTQTVTRRVLRSPERFEWVPVLCDENATVSSVSQIQSVLAAQGYYSGPVDGIMGAETTQAVAALQRSRGIPHQGHLSADTLAALGLGELAGGSSAYAAAPPAAQPDAPPPVQAAQVAAPASPPAAVEVALPARRAVPAELRYGQRRAADTAPAGGLASRFSVAATDADDRVLAWAGKN